MQDETCHEEKGEVVYLELIGLEVTSIFKIAWANFACWRAEGRRDRAMNSKDKLQNQGRYPQSMSPFPKLSWEHERQNCGRRSKQARSEK